MAKILGISGSLREQSYNTALLREAAAVAPDTTVIDVATLHGIPLYDGDLEAEKGAPAAVVKLKERVAMSDALLLVTPEYNQSLPGVFKNAIDWLSRASSGQTDAFRGKPVALIGATPGRGGTRNAQDAWVGVFRSLGLLPWFGKQLYVAGAGNAFQDGELVDEMVRKLLVEFVTDFAVFVDEHNAQ